MGQFFIIQQLEKMKKNVKWAGEVEWMGWESGRRMEATNYNFHFRGLGLHYSRGVQSELFMQTIKHSIILCKFSVFNR